MRPKFTKGHYQVIAARIAKWPLTFVDSLDVPVRFYLAGDFAQMFAGDDQEFNREEFIRACGAGKVKDKTSFDSIQMHEPGQEPI